MKNVMFVLAAALWVSPAFATPRVGDRADFNATVTKGNQSATGSVSLELTAYNPSTKEWTQKTTVQWATQPAQSQEDKVSAQDLLDDATIDALLTGDNCKNEGGKLETVKVAAGTYNTCSIPSSQEDPATKKVTTSNVWIGKAPLGIVRFQQSADGVTQNFELRASKAGN
jgi:hypothetical protein